MPQIYINGTNY